MKAPRQGGPLIENIVVSCYTVPTETPESDGTLFWTETTLVLVEAKAGGETGIGYSYADAATGKLAESLLRDVVIGMNAFDVPGHTLPYSAKSAILAGRVLHRWPFLR